MVSVYTEPSWHPVDANHSSVAIGLKRELLREVIDARLIANKHTIVGLRVVPLDKTACHDSRSITRNCQHLRAVPLLNCHTFYSDAWAAKYTQLCASGFT